MGTLPDRRPRSGTGQQIALDGSGLDARHGCDAVLDDPGDVDRHLHRRARHPDPGLGAGARRRLLHDLPVAGPEFTNLVFGNKSSPRPSRRPSNTEVERRPWPCRTARPATPTTGSSARARPTTPGSADPDQGCYHAFDKRSNRVERASPAERRRHRRERHDVHLEGLPGHQPAVRPTPPTARRPGQAAQQVPGPGVARPRPSARRWSTRSRSTRRRTPPFNKTYPEGKLYWRVQAVDGAGNGLAWTDPWSFTKASAKPQLHEPR